MTNDSLKSDSIRFYTYDIEKSIQYWDKSADTFTINNLAKNIRFIPLETNDQVLLSIGDFNFAKIDNYFIASSWGGSRGTNIMKFDTTGKYIEDIIRIGQGPGELPHFIRFFNNDFLKKIYAVGGGKITGYDFEKEHTYDIFPENLVSYLLILLNDGSYASYAYSHRGDTEKPYFYFYDDKGKISKNLFYTKKRNISYKIREGAYNGPYEAYRLSSDYAGNGLFKDVFNDTIYRIKEDLHTMEPYIYLHLGKFEPNIEEADDRSKKATKVYVSHGFTESRDYFLLKYAYNNVWYSGIWEKSSQKLITNLELDGHSNVTSFTNVVNYRTPTGKKLPVGIVQVTENQFYCVLRASDAMDFIPGLAEEDNPVIMIVDLK